MRSGGSWFMASPDKKFTRPHLKQQLDVVAHICHPKLCRRLRSDISWILASLGKNVLETPSQWKKAGCGGAHLSSQ
jgi:hypothetical protein